MALPGNVDTGFVTATIMDTAGQPAVGKVTIKASPSVLRDVTADPRPVLILPRPLVVPLDSNGVVPVTELVATDDPDLNPTGWTYSVTFDITGGSLPGFSFELPSGTTVDLGVASPVGSSNGVLITQGPKGDPGDPGVGVPDPSAVPDGKVLTTAGGVSEWADPTGGGSASWDTLAGKPAVIAAGADVAAARAAIGAGTAAQGAKADTSVQLSGDQTISGVKSFASVINGTAKVAQKLQTPRAVNGVPFDGTADITVADATKVVAAATFAEAGAGEGYWARADLTFFDDGSGKEPLMVYGFRGAAHRAFWLNENGSPRAASIANEPALKVFGPAADSAYAGLVLQVLSRWDGTSSQQHLYGIRADGNPIVGTGQTVGAHTVVLEAADPVPAGLPAGTVIIRKPA